ncbi:MAG TPA: PqqD family protein [Clostridiaceae bacterium]|nr:PqqD family protein [Clostridiaceae bacterium]
MSKKIKKTDNYLELVPVKSDRYTWTENKDGIVRIIVPRDKALDRIVRAFFKTPSNMNIDLDSYGSAVWKEIDGKRNVGEIGDLMKKEFGESIEPLYERLSTFINQLRNNKFITLSKVDHHVG